MALRDPEAKSCDVRQRESCEEVADRYCMAEDYTPPDRPPVPSINDILVDFFGLDDDERLWMTLCNLALRPIPFKHQENAECLIEKVTHTECIGNAPDGSKLACTKTCPVRTCFHDPDACQVRTKGIDFNSVAASVAHLWGLDELQGVQLHEETQGLEAIQLDADHGATYREDDEGNKYCLPILTYDLDVEKDPECDNEPSDHWTDLSPCGPVKKKDSWLPWGDENGRWISRPFRLRDLCSINDDLSCGLFFDNGWLMVCYSGAHGLGCNENGSARPGPGKNPIPVHGSETLVPHNKLYIKLEDSLEFDEDGNIILALDPCFFEHAPRGGAWPNGSLKTWLRPRYDQVAHGATIIDGLVPLTLPPPGLNTWTPYLTALVVNPSPCQPACLYCTLHVCNIELRYFGGLLTSGIPGTQWTFTMEADAPLLGYPNDDRCFINVDCYWTGHDGSVALANQPFVANMAPGLIAPVRMRIRGWVWNGTGFLGTWRPSTQIIYWIAVTER